MRSQRLFLALGLLLAGCGEKSEGDAKEEESTGETGTVSGGGGGGTGGGNGSKDTTVIAIDKPAVQETPNGKKILMVVANLGFYFKEYMDPRLEFEAAGYSVVVAAHESNEAVPHPNTGQRPEDGNGNIVPDLKMTDVKADDYEAIVFPGGWGASRSYYAYDGSIDSPMWARVAGAAEETNTLINAFHAQGKYIVGICNGVPLLAWSRVGGESLLKGKTVSAPDGGAPAQTYKGQHYNDEVLPMGTFVVDNGATLVPYYSIGDASTATDDVSVDGKVITAQNQFSADLAGKKLVELLKID